MSGGGGAGGGPTAGATDLRADQQQSQLVAVVNLREDGGREGLGEHAGARGHAVRMHGDARGRPAAPPTCQALPTLTVTKV